MHQFPSRQEFFEDFDFKNASKLGSGTFGIVYKAKVISASLPQGNYALKMIETQSEQAYELAIQELNLYQLITFHKNVIKVHKVYSWVEEPTLGKKYVLVFAMELGLNSLKADIDERRKEQQEFRDDMIVDIMMQCLSAFHHLAKNKHLYHRDIKPENILVTSRQPYTVKLADFGAGKETFPGQAMLNTLVGTPLFLSPKLFVAYATNQPGKVKHDLEKSDVFSLGITFLQMILLLPDRDLAKLNDPLVYEEKTGNPIDTSDDPGKRKDCPGWQKLQNYINQIKNPTLKACIYGMTEFCEKNRFNWSQAIKTLDPNIKEDEGEKEKQHPGKINDQVAAIKSYSNENTTLRYLGPLNDNLNHKKIISAGNQILSFSQEGIRLISLTGVTETIFTQNVQFMTYLPVLNVCVGITKAGEVFGVNLKNKAFHIEKIQNFAHDKITVMKYMRKDLCVLGNQFGEVLILAFDTQPPSVIKKYKDIDRSVIDLIYDDANKFIISSHENFIIFCKYLVVEQHAQFQYECQLTNLQFISSDYFSGISKNLPIIPIFQIKDGIITLRKKCQINGNNIPLALTLSDNYLVWVSEKFIGSLQVNAQLNQLKEENINELCVNASKPAHLLCYLEDEKMIIASDGIQLHKYQIGKQSQSKTVCQNCQIF